MGLGKNEQEEAFWRGKLPPGAKLIGNDMDRS